MKKFITATALVATLGVGATTVAGTAAFAHDGAGGKGQWGSQQNRSERRHKNDPSNDNLKTDAQKLANVQSVRHNHKGWVLGRHWLINSAADAIGIEPSALRTQLRDGMSIAEVAAANNVAPATVVTALVTQLSSHIDAAAAKGKISAEKAAAMKASLTDRITKFVNAKKIKPAPATDKPTT
jgi:hypothetical protein